MSMGKHSSYCNKTIAINKKKFINFKTDMLISNINIKIFKENSNHKQLSFISFPNKSGANLLKFKGFLITVQISRSNTLKSKPPIWDINFLISSIGMTHYIKTTNNLNTWTASIRLLKDKIQAWNIRLGFWSKDKLNWLNMKTK